MPPTPLPGVTVRISGSAPFQVEKIIADFSKPRNHPFSTAGGPIAFVLREQVSDIPFRRGVKAIVC